MDQIDTYIENIAVHNISTYKLNVPEMQLLGLNLRFVPTPQMNPILKTPSFKDEFEKLRRNLRIKEMFKNRIDDGIIDKYKIPVPDWQPEPMNAKLENDLTFYYESIHNRLKNLPPILSNLSSPQEKALRNLRKNLNLIIKPADKNLGPCVIDKSQYMSAVYEQLNNISNYEPVPAGKLMKVIETFRKMILCYIPNIYKNRKVVDFFMKTVQEAKACPFYLIPKLHKVDHEGKMKLGWRPIVSAHSAYSRNFSIWLADFLQPYVEAQTHIIKNSTVLIQEIDLKTIPRDCYLITGDVESLYPNIDIKDLIICLRKLMPEITKANHGIITTMPFENTEDIIRMVEFLLRNNIIIFDEKCWMQKDGIAMGNNASVQLANIFMLSLEQELLNGKLLRYPYLDGDILSPRIKVKNTLVSYARYIDDIFMICKIKDAVEICGLFNKSHPKIKINWKYSKDCQEFLDINILNIQLEIQCEVFQKPMNRYLYLPYKSCHPHAMFKGWIIAELNRYSTISSKLDSYLEVKIKFFKRLKERGYPSNLLLDLFCNHTFKPVRKPPKLETRKMVPFILEFSPFFKGINFKVDLENIIPSYYYVIVAWKKAQTLSNLLVSANLKEDRQILISTDDEAFDLESSNDSCMDPPTDD